MTIQIVSFRHLLNIPKYLKKQSMQRGDRQCKLLSILDHVHKTTHTTRTIKPLEYEVSRLDFLQDEMA